jgi:hypothetical protein
MSPEEKMRFLALKSTDDGTIRDLYIWQYLQQIASAQRTSALDTIFTLIGGFVTLINFLSFYQFPTSAPFVLGLSVLFVGIIVYFWWNARQGEKGEEALMKAVQFRIGIDEMRRYSRQLKIAETFPQTDTDFVEIEKEIRNRLLVTLSKLNLLKEGMTNNDYFLLGENPEEIRSEIEASSKNAKVNPGEVKS